eukprot:gene22872-biopygen8279
MSRGGCSRPESSWNQLPIPRFARDQQLRFQLDSIAKTPLILGKFWGYVAVYRGMGTPNPNSFCGQNPSMYTFHNDSSLSAEITASL